MSPVHTLRRHPMLGLCLAMLLVLGISGAALALHYATVLSTKSANHYGQALANGGAVRAVEPALTQDMISLQVILQFLADQPDVLGATIHDVENRLLVQSGLGKLPTGFTELQFTAPITLDTHIAGHLTVSLALAPAHQAFRHYLWLWTLGVLLAMMTCYFAYPRLAARTETSIGDRNMQAQPEAALVETESNELAGTPVETVIVELRLENLSALTQQLARSALEARLLMLNRLLKGTMALYSGELLYQHENRFILKVDAEQQDDAAFYAICISRLLITMLLQQTSPRLKLSARLFAANTPEALSECCTPAAAGTSPGAIWVAPSLQSDALKLHIDLDEHECVYQIKPPYQSLLERQCLQLEGLINHEDSCHQ